MVRVIPASAQDVLAIRALLERCELPTSDLESAQPQFAVIQQDGQVVAVGALQRFGTAALLRSVAVAPERQGGGLGRSLVSGLERLAQAAEIRRLVLLTQTAADFFACQGFQTIERSSAPADIQASEEFRSLCPSSAICMAKDLGSST